VAERGFSEQRPSRRCSRQWRALSLDSSALIFSFVSSLVLVTIFQKFKNKTLLK